MSSSTTQILFFSTCILLQILSLCKYDTERDGKYCCERGVLSTWFFLGVLPLVVDHPLLLNAGPHHGQHHQRPHQSQHKGHHGEHQHGHPHGHHWGHRGHQHHYRGHEGHPCHQPVLRHLYVVDVLLPGLITVCFHTGDIF